MKNIAIFCSASDLEEKYIKPAQEFAVLLAENGHHLIWGGSDKGLMKIIASTFKDNGRQLIGVSIPAYKDFARKDADEMIIAKTLGERKALILERCDIAVALVGGIGTLDEVTEIIELRKQKHHNKPIVVLNTDNFYEGLKTQLNKMHADGFIPVNLEDLVHFADTPQDAISYIEKALI